MPNDNGLTEYTLTCEDAINFICESPTGYAEIGVDDRFKWINQSYAAILNAHREQVLGTTWMKWTHPDDLGLDSGFSQRVQRGELRQYRMVKRYQQLGHTAAVPRIVWGELTVFGKFNEQGAFVGYRVTFVPYMGEPSRTFDLDVKKWLPALLKLCIENWKTVLAVILTLGGLTQLNSSKLLEQLQAVERLKQEIENSSSGSAYPSLSPPPGQSAPK